MEEGIFVGTAYHTRIVPHPHRFKSPISMELKQWRGKDIPAAAIARNPDNIWRMSTIGYLGYVYSPILFYFLFSEKEKKFYHVFIHTPDLDGVFQCYDFPLVDNTAKTEHICKTGDISPLGVKIDTGSHSYKFIFESDFKDRFFVRIDTFVNQRAHMKCVMKVRRQPTPSIMDLVNGSSWAFKIRTLFIALFLFIRGLMINRGWMKGIQMEQLIKEIKSTSMKTVELKQTKDQP